jgi:hypothetical protein
MRADRDNQCTARDPHAHAREAPAMAYAGFFRRLGISIDEPCCARCGYNVKGLPSFVCPECGSDLREAGIVTPGRYGPVLRAWGIRTWKRVRLLGKALLVAVQAGSFAAYNAFRIVWRSGTREHVGPIRFTVRVGREPDAHSKSPDPERAIRSGAVDVG